MCPFSDNHHCSYVAKSQDHWNKRGTMEALKNKEYTIERHKDWCDQNNVGVTHLGICPSKYEIYNMVFDAFHRRRNVIKIILSYIHTLLEGNVAALEVFSDVFLRMKYWGGYEVTPWLLNQPNSRLKGRHTK